MNTIERTDLTGKKLPSKPTTTPPGQTSQEKALSPTSVHTPRPGEPEPKVGFVVVDEAQACPFCKGRRVVGNGSGAFGHFSQISAKIAIVTRFCAEGHTYWLSVRT